MSRIFCECFFFLFFRSSAKYLPGGNASDLVFIDFLGHFLRLAKRLFGIVSLQS